MQSLIVIHTKSKTPSEIQKAFFIYRFLITNLDYEFLF
jgi:hypothetical protein